MVEKEQKKKIMMFETDEFLVNMYKEIFERAGFDFVWHKDPGKNIVAAVTKENPDIISMDILMDEMDGFEAAGLLKDDPGTKEVPIVFLTNLSEEEDRKKGVELGAADYILKAGCLPAEVVDRFKRLIK